MTNEKDRTEKIMYDIKDLQKVFGVCKNTAYEIARLNTFPKIIIHGRYYFPIYKVEKWIENNLGKSIN